MAGDEPRVEVDRYVVYPTGYDDLVHSDKDSWCLSITNGHAWGLAGHARARHDLGHGDEPQRRVDR